jgi:oligoribonuclease
LDASAASLIWLDLEMTGLDPEQDRIIEIATVVTDDQLNIIAEGPVLAIHQSATVMAAMDEWNTSQHGQSGLTQRVLESTISMAQAEQQTLDFLRRYLKPGQSPLCGNSIYQDRRFLYRYMPKLEAFCHYRNLDVSTLKELASRWAPKEIVAGFVKQEKHLALADIKESIAELVYYRQHFIRSFPQ